MGEDQSRSTVTIEISAQEWADLLQIVRSADKLDHAIHLLEPEQVAAVEAALLKATNQEQKELSLPRKVFADLEALVLAAIPDFERVGLPQTTVDKLSDDLHIMARSLMSEEERKNSDAEFKKAFPDWKPPN